MKHVLLGCIWALGLAGQPLTQEERDRAMSHLHATRKMFLDAIDGLSTAQWTFKAAPERWSIAEVAEHIAVSEDSFHQLITQRVLKTPPAPDKKADLANNDETILKQVVDRERKAQAPEFLRPAGRWPNRESLAAAFRTSRDRNIAYVEKTTEELRSHSTPHPAFGLMDAYQWLLTMSAHSERHVAQILEVKADSRFPK